MSDSEDIVATGKARSKRVMSDSDDDSDAPIRKRAVRQRSARPSIDHDAIPPREAATDQP